MDQEIKKEFEDLVRENPRLAKLIEILHQKGIFTDDDVKNILRA